MKRLIEALAVAFILALPLTIYFYLMPQDCRTDSECLAFCDPADIECDGGPQD